jgi:formylglycine-generating enzyme required for sulfatase activity
MRAPLVRLFLLLSLLIASSASAVTMDWAPVGNLGNSCDPQPNVTGAGAGCFGAVPYSYNIGTYEVTNAQYAEFLNAKAKSDPLGLYNPYMASIPNGAGGITRTGDSGNYTYATIPGRENMPVNWVAFFNAARFANWMSNGQGSGDTENGAYTLLGGSSTPSNSDTVTRNQGAVIVLPTENEWYKAAYYNGLSGTYLDYPAGSDAQTTCAAPVATANQANCSYAVRDLTPIGSYAGSGSPYGTFDQGGNLAEWNETIISYSGEMDRGIRGGDFLSSPSTLAASYRLLGSGYEGYESATLGFRLVMVPEPGTGLLVVAGLLGLAGWRRARD